MKKTVIDIVPVNYYGGHQLLWDFPQYCQKTQDLRLLQLSSIREPLLLSDLLFIIFTKHLNDCPVSLRIHSEKENHTLVEPICRVK